MDNINLTNKEIWDFLKNKMSKNGLVPKASIIHTHVEDYPNNEIEIIKAYYQSDVINAIAIAYRSGYLRAMKGRPFMIGKKKAKEIKEEKKQGGKWVPVDPNNLPKEGTKVRYARECRDYSKDAFYNFGTSVVEIGDTGHVNVNNCGWFGIRLDNPRSIYSWLSFGNERIQSCLDMWVEDDE